MEIKKRKKLAKRSKTIGLLIIFLIIILSIVLLLNDSSKSLKNLNLGKPKFEIKNRSEQIKESKKTDTDEYETIAWVRVEGTNIDYPVIIDETGNYLNPVNKPAYGWLNSYTKTYKNNLTIDGHNVMNLGVPKKTSKTFSRFEELMAFAYYDFAKENQFIQLTMDGKNYLYQVFAVTFLYNLDFHNLPSETADEEEQQYSIDFLKQQSIYDYKIDVNTSDYILNVATCTRLFGKKDRTNFVVSAKRIDNKDIKYNKVRKTKGYNRVDKKLKGSEKNESENEEETI